jgi:zinc transport system substrate-binding protein
MIQVNNICNGFIKIDPANKERYISSRDAYQQDLMRMDSILNQSLSSGKRKIFVVHHPAWSYLASEYGLTQIPLMENEKEPGPRYLAWVIETARMNGVKTIFVEPQYNPKAAMVIAGEMNCTVETIDPLAENYLESLERSGRLIAESLG